MDLELIPDSDPRLRAVSEPINPRNLPEELGDFEALIDQMYEFMRENNGMGLAAPQIGITKRFFIISYEGRDYTCLNPRVIKADTATESGIEGCLSFPGVRVRVERSEAVKVEYTTPKGMKRSRTFKGVLARCFLHELDHLDGIVFLDRGTAISQP